jgi:hypothetical protein
MIGVLLSAALLAVSSPAVEPAVRVVEPVASAVEVAENGAASSMLGESGYAIAKDKLD